MAIHQNGGSSTCVIEPFELQDLSNHLSKPQEAKTAGLRLSDAKGVTHEDDDDSPIDLPSPTTHPAVKAERWNHPRSNLFKTIAAFWSFVVMGSNDAAYGALIPYVSRIHSQMLRESTVLIRKIVARLLQSHICGDFAGFLVALGGIHGICFTQQLYPFEVWPARRGDRGAGMSLGCVYYYCSASAVSCVGYNLHGLRVWKWPR